MIELRLRADTLKTEVYMKTTKSLALAAALLIGMAACSHHAANPPARAIPGSGDVVGDVVIEQALFGSGAHLVDVTSRAVQLLRSEPQGFTARADWLRIDPEPGKNKSLLLRYNYRGKERFFIVTGENRVSYNALISDAREQ